MKNIDDMTDDEVNTEIKRLLNMTEEEKEKEILRIQEEYTRFRTETIPQILQICEEGQYGIDTCCQGLVVILRALIQNFGTKEMLDACVYDLTENMDDLRSIPIEE